MPIVFIDLIDWDYDPDTPAQRPLGGTQSAICYLSAALAAAGESVFLINRTASAHWSKGVRCCPADPRPDGIHIDPEAAEVLKRDDTFVLVASLAESRIFEPLLGQQTTRVLWTQHADDQPSAQPLTEAAARDGWDGFVFVSDWQRRAYISRFSLPSDRCLVLPNAVAPVFEDLPDDPDAIMAARLAGPVMVYSSTPYRGLDLLLAAIPSIRRQYPTAVARIHSSMQVYNADAGSDGFASLYDQCRATEGVDYRGSVPQPDLARSLSECTLLAYPNSFPETFCISALEALVAGCQIVTSDLGALPEICGGHAEHVSFGSGGNIFVERFARATAARMSLMASDIQAERERIRGQRDFVRDATWSNRVGILQRIRQAVPCRKSV